MSLKSIIAPFVYSVLDAATLGRGVRRNISGYNVRFPLRWARYFPVDYEPDTFAWLRRSCKQGGVALDIGAHIGLFSVVMARMVGPSGRVFSFEPTPFTNAVLRQTVQLNRPNDNIEVRNEAVADRARQVAFYDTGDTVSNANSMVRPSRSARELVVEAVSVDKFIDTRKLAPSCMKIDVEGAEYNVLVGAQRTYELYHPATHLALHPSSIEQAGQSLHQIWELLGEYGMRVSRLGQLVDRNWFCDQQGLFDVDLHPAGRAAG